jgi:hypothetical protein
MPNVKVRPYMKPYHRKSILKDVLDLKDKLRYEDKREVETLGHSPEQALGFAYLSSTMCRSIMNSYDQVVGMYGVVPCSGSEISGIVWMLGSNGLLNIKTSFLKESRSEVAGMNKMYPHLCNLIDSRNEVHLRWIKWCGFKIIGERMFNNVKFFEFCKVVR